jgi:hypothetical protein
MAIKLTDIVLVMKNKWTYGDKFFGYTEEFNDNHNTQYPSLLITPPTSTFPEVGINNGWEEYTFEVYFSDLYNRTQQANEEIDQTWQNLQDLATEWLDNFLKYYQDSAPVIGYLEDENVTIERNKEVANDQLIQIKMIFTWKVLSKCFRPVSGYPPDINADNLVLWLRADSGVTFNIPTKKISVWADQSGNGNDISQLTSASQPLRYNYDGASDKARIEFNGTSDYFCSGVVGSELNILPNSDPAIGDHYEFTQYGTNEIDYIGGNTTTITYIDNANGGYEYFGSSHNCPTGLEIGKVYRVEISSKINTGSFIWELRDGATTFSIDTITSQDFVTTTYYFVAKHATNCWLRASSLDNGEIVYVNKVSVKEMESGLCPITNESFGIFIVAKTTTNPTDDARYFGYTDGGSDKIILGSKGDKLQFKVTDDNGASTQVLSIQDTTEYHIASARFDGGGGNVYLQYNNETEVTGTISGYSHSGGWDDNMFTLGWILNGLAKNYLKGDVQEVIIYNGGVTDSDRDKIKNYLNNKYNIY